MKVLKFKQENVQVGDVLVIDGVNYEVDACITGKEQEIFMVNLETGKRKSKFLKDFKFDKYKETSFKKAA